MSAGDQVLYVYHCKCGHLGQVHYADDSYDNAPDRCETCGGVVHLEWDGGVTLEASREAASGPRGASKRVSERSGNNSKTRCGRHS